ncbi:hypothetical protein [Marinococcus luteus]|uniref:hypothetical protein n=1 Tax=Marinococcus luteus TaxID=1122204 RepID=UPI002ACCD6CD|nr:hypothetical protein [Marinococcus luteus]MDZ5781949.1 hypothetical protein [Marinococcus luteus]
MKKMILGATGLLLLSACTNGDMTYGVENKEAENEEDALLANNAYQVTVDDSFEFVSNYERGDQVHRMFFWQESAADNFEYNLDTTNELLREEVPTIDIYPVNKYEYIYTEEYLDFDITEEEAEENKEDVKQDVENNAAAYLDDMKDDYIERVDEDVDVITNEENDLDPFTYMVKHETEGSFTRYELFGEGDAGDYLRAALTVPDGEDEELFETMLDSLQTITFDPEEFDENADMDEPARLAYEPSENLKGDYPEVGYSFERPENAEFFHSYPVYHVYRYTFATMYENSGDMEDAAPGRSDLVVRAEKQENAPNREQELRNRAAEDFVTFPDDYARTVDYLHEDEGFDTGVFTTAVRVEFGEYEEYWFLKEVDGHVYEVTFNVAFEAENYDELLEDYLNVIRSFELTDVEE